MAHYKNRKPKSFKGCCKQCCLLRTDGRRNHRLPSEQERRAADAEAYYWRHEEPTEKEPRE